MRKQPHPPPFLSAKSPPCKGARRFRASAPVRGTMSKPASSRAFPRAAAYSSSVRNRKIQATRWLIRKSSFENEDFFMWKDIFNI